MDERLKNKRILLQGASRGNLGFIKTAKEHGVYVVMTGLGGDFPCNPYADEFCKADILDCDAVLKVAQDHHVDGAIICCSDTGLQAVGRCNDVMGLTGLSEKSAEMAFNKLLMKERLTDAGVRTAKFYKVFNEKDLQDAVKGIGYPVIIKAVDLQGSRGINIVKEEQDLQPSFRDTMSLTRTNYCIVEEYLVGKEFGVQSFVYNNEVIFVLPHGDETFMCKTAVPIGHYMPYEMSDTQFNETCGQVKKAIAALGFNNCAVNVDLIERNGEVYIIELTGRVGANCLPELTSNFFGINYYEMILATCLGESPLQYWEQRKTPCATMARMIKSEKKGVVKSISLPKTGNDAEIHLFVHEGSEVRVFTNSNDAIGEIIVKGATLKDCELKLQSILKSIEVRFI